MIKWFKKLFQKPIIQKEIHKKTIKELDYIDTIWIKENDIIYEGWVFDITRRSIVICYDEDLKDYRFRIAGLGDNTEIIQDNKILYCNEPSK